MGWMEGKIPERTIRFPWTPSESLCQRSWTIALKSKGDYKKTIPQEVGIKDCLIIQTFKP